MATTQLSLYNEALLLVGERELTTVTDDVEARHRLDTAYANGVDYCFELVNPVFARKTTNLTTYVVSSEHAYDNVFTLPSDYIDIVEVYSDEKLDQPISRYIIEGGTLACNYTSIYLRYISNGYALTTWDKSFEQVVISYLALMIAPRIAPDEMERLDAQFAARVREAVKLRDAKEPGKRSSDEGATLTNEYRAIYNDALQILGLEEINSNADDSDRKVKLDVALSSALVEDLLDDTGWHWTITSFRAQYNPSYDPAWGYQKVFDKPGTMHRLDGVFQDEYMHVPLKLYKDEGEYIFADLDTIYIQFVDSTFVTSPALWPAHFKRLVAARLAKDTAPTLRPELIEHAERVYDNRRSLSRNNDIMQSPPRLLSQGTWTSSRHRGSYYRGRP